ncbi:DUF169 domain-containing protein [Adlercreutzia murintestinalis]|uniref:DUF169 domain-containing protein n=1 Tax=Adlercreutzia murintestinalis TaxID=2941325 RepID=UPI0020413B5E|nr:DUF169 domain-containing protein [Adlercreutzia murintestinalis]
MNGNLAEALKLSHRPVGIWFGSEEPRGYDPDAQPSSRCVLPYLLAASAGKSFCMREEDVKCPGGAVGLGFGDAFEKRHASTRFLLSHGEESEGYDPQVKLPPQMKRGERFFDCPDTVMRWKGSLGLEEADYLYVCMTPLDDAAGRPYDRDPDLVFLLANPDQLSALVIMCGYRNGRPLNVVAPFCGACQSILLAKQELAKEDPMAILGMFDLAQRHRVEKDLLSLTMVYGTYEALERDCDEGCLASHAWGQITERQ